MWLGELVDEEHAPPSPKYVEAVSDAIARYG
jgi:hypothetical protein